MTSHAPAVSSSTNRETSSYPKMFKRLLLTVAFAASAPLFATTATSLSSFGGIEEPKVIYYPSSNSFQSDSYVNITDLGGGVFQMKLRYNTSGTDWWDGDRTTSNTDRQRAEIKTLGTHQLIHQTYDYTTTWKMNSGFVASGGFCHITQLKSVDGTEGSSGAPLITTSLFSGSSSAAVRYASAEFSGTNVFSPRDVRSITYSPGTFLAEKIRVHTTADGEHTGEVLVSLNGDSLRGVTNVEVTRPSATEYYPKWGFYRKITTSSGFGSGDYIQHSNVSAGPASSTPQASAPSFSPGGGTYSTAQTVTITTSTSGATIRYTTDGSTPTETNGTVYSSPVTISATTTLKAIAYASGYTDSSVSSATYTISTGGGGSLFWEAEALSVTNSGVGTSLQTDSNTSGGQWISLNGTGTGQWMQFTLPNVPAGTYTLKMAYKSHPSRGILALSVDGTQVGSTLDQYAATPAYPTQTFGTVTFSSTGNHTVRLTVTGKNSASSGYILSADDFTLEPTSAPPPTLSVEAESLSPSTSGPTVTTQSDTNASGGVVTYFNATAAGDFVEYNVSGFQAGTYQLRFRYKQNASRGQHVITIDGVQVGGTIDEYASTSGYTTVTVGNVSFASAGSHLMRLMVTGKNSSSGSYVLAPDSFTFVGQ
jgi:hypothetical protein